MSLIHRHRPLALLPLFACLTLLAFAALSACTQKPDSTTASRATDEQDEQVETVENTERVEHVERPEKIEQFEKLVSALEQLTAHAAGTTVLTDVQIEQHNQTLKQFKSYFGDAKPVMQAALELVAAHDANHTPLFVETDNEWGRDGRQGLRWAVFHAMHFLLAEAYTPENLERYPDLLGQAAFASAKDFPGEVDKPTDPTATYSVPIWATFPDTPAWEYWWGPHTARKPTGAYLAPGTIVTVKVPQKIVGKGFLIRVGVHANNLSHKKWIDRLWSISLTYPIDDIEVKIANPVGGGIYIEVPEGVDEGETRITFQNIVRAPFYSNTRVRQTSLEEWRNVERHHPAPWADFQSEAFMMQLPRVWVYSLDDPQAVMAKWDKAMTAAVNVMGFEIGDVGRESFYIHPDTQLSASIFCPGHPQVNIHADDLLVDQHDGHNAETFHLKGPEHAPEWVFQMWGYARSPVGPKGELKTTCNFLHVAANHGGLGQDIDAAFRNSRGGGTPGVTVDNAAVNWMTALNFDGYEMQKAQKYFQFIGHAKYVDIGRLFDWDTLGDFYETVNRERIAHRRSDGALGVAWPREVDNERFIKRLSVTSGVDMRPLFHLWGTPEPHSLTLATDVDRIKEQINRAKADIQAARPNPPDVKGYEKVGIKEARFNLERLEHLSQKIFMHNSVIIGLQTQAQKVNAEYEQLIATGKIKRSAKIYDQLIHYKSLVPADNQAFREFARAWYGWEESPPEGKMWWTARDHRKQWYRYDKQSAAHIHDLLDEVIGFYFPHGRPAE